MKNLDNYQEPQEGAIMENPQISEETREKLEDATVSLFMDQYAKAMNAGFEAMMEESADNEFPPELEKRCLALIEQEYAKERNKRRRKAALRVLRSAAAVVVVVLGLCSVLFMTVEAFRVPIMNFFTEKHDGYLKLNGVYADDDIPDSFNPDDPLGSILAEDYTLIEIQNNWQEGLLSATYSSNDDSFIVFSVESAESTLITDDENATTDHFQLFSYDAYLLCEKDVVRLEWLDATNGRMFSLYGVCAEKDMIIATAESVILQLD